MMPILGTTSDLRGNVRIGRDDEVTSTYLPAVETTFLSGHVVCTGKKARR